MGTKEWAPDNPGQRDRSNDPFVIQKNPRNFRTGGVKGEFGTLNWTLPIRVLLAAVIRRL